MSLRSNYLFIVAALLLALIGPSMVHANPMEELGPDQVLYQRVRSLEKYGLLAPEDQAVLDEGKYVTRLELAFYTEKAKAIMEAPSLAAPSMGAPTAVPTEAPAAVTAAPTIAEIPTMEPTPMVYVDPRVRAEIDQLLKELKSESGDLRSQWTQEDQRIKDRQKEIDALNKVQDSLNDNFRQSNGKMKMPTFDSYSRLDFETLSLTGPSTKNGPTSVNGFQLAPIPSVSGAIRVSQQDEIKMTTDLGGVGSLSMFLGATLTNSNASASGFPGTYSAPASIFIMNPDFATQFDGPLGTWNTHVAVEAYPGALSFGDFSRGVQPSSLKLDQDPFDIRRASDDKNGKLWDDYMTNISAVQENNASGNIQSTYDRVFDGIYGVGNNLPFIGGDTRLVLLVGRMGITNLQSQRWEEGAKLDSTIIPGLRAELSTEWVNDHFATLAGGPELDQKAYEAMVNYNSDQFNVNVELGLSDFATGVNNVSPSNPSGTATSDDIQAPAAQASISYYPLAFYYSAISDSFASVQSRVAMAGLHMDQYGLTNPPSVAMDAYGWIGEADTLVSDRYGWRVNFGWDGRKQTWMKNWPSFFDAIVINLNVSQKSEYVAEYSENNYNVIEAINMTTLYYPDDEGLWGLSFWGGYGEGGIANWDTVRSNYTTNVEAYRNDGYLAAGDVTRYQYTMSSERIPLIIPQMAGGAPATTSTGTNIYNSIDNLKTYNYITLTTKIEFNKLLNFNSPVYGSIFFTDNNVAASGVPTTIPTATGSNANTNVSSGTKLFDQTVYDFALMFQVFRNVNLLGDYGLEQWQSAYTYPLINYRTDSLGVGFAYDIPWGGAKWEFRFKHVIFADQYVPVNNYQADQFFSTVRFLF